MRCERYEKILTEVAASGSQPAADVRAHLDACAPCQALFEREQALFVAIDAGVRQSANATVPPSLAAGLRVRFASDSDFMPYGVLPPWLRASAASAAMLLIVAYVSFMRSSGHRSPDATIAPQTEKEISQGSPFLAPMPSSPRSITIAQSGRGSSVGNPHNHTVRRSEPELLIPEGERRGFVRLVSDLFQDNELADALTNAVPEDEHLLVKIEPLQVDRIYVKNLQERQR